MSRMLRRAAFFLRHYPATFASHKFTSTETWAARSAAGIYLVLLDATDMTGGSLRLDVDSSTHDTVNAGSAELFIVEATTDVEVISQSTPDTFAGTGFATITYED